MNSGASSDIAQAIIIDLNKARRLVLLPILDLGCNLRNLFLMHAILRELILFIVKSQVYQGLTHRFTHATLGLAEH